MNIDILSVIIAWAVAFTVIMVIILTLGFGPAGVVAGMKRLSDRHLLSPSMNPLRDLIII